MRSFIMLLALTIILSQSIIAQKDKTFKVSKGGKLEMNVNYGDIRVETGNIDEVVVSADDDWEEGDNISQSGNTIKIQSDYSKDYRVRIPQDFSVNLSSSGGDITISGNLNGDMSVSTAAGSIKFADVTGIVSVNTAGGDISGSNIRGKTNLNTAGGNIRLISADGELIVNSAGGDIQVEKMSKGVSVSTGGGNIDLGSSDGKALIRTGGGNVNVSSAPMGINVTTGGGNLVIADSKGDVSVTTGGGDIKVINKSGNIKITTGAGSVFADLAPLAPGEPVDASTKGKSSITNGYGDVKVLLPANAKSTIRIFTDEKNRGDEVEISSDFTRTRQERKDEKLIHIYEINGGGNTIDINCGYGTVEIKKK